MHLSLRFTYNTPLSLEHMAVNMIQKNKQNKKTAHVHFYLRPLYHCWQSPLKWTTLTSVIQVWRKAKKKNWRISATIQTCFKGKDSIWSLHLSLRLHVWTESTGNEPENSKQCGRTVCDEQRRSLRLSTIAPSQCRNTLTSKCKVHSFHLLTEGFKAA